MTLNYLQRNRKPQIYIRFIDGKKTDLTIKTGINVQAKFWNAKTQKIRLTNDMPNAINVNIKLEKLKSYLFDKYNTDFATGKIINKQWIEVAILDFFNRPKTEQKKSEKHTIFFTDFAIWWLDNKAPNYKTTTGKPMTINRIKQYQQNIELINEFQNKNKLQLQNINTSWINDFLDFITTTKGYATSTANAIITNFKFFCFRAEELNIQINKSYKQRVFTQKQDKTIKQPYLNETEIKTIFNYDFQSNQLNETRDNFIIGLWTGLRVSDFLKRLKINDIKNDFIEIQTQKTKTYVAIPLHHQIKEILKRRNGQLPPKISIQHFNRNIKKICEIVGINAEMLGSITGRTSQNSKRKKTGVYKKYQLVSSHICRRSFCTNLFGKVPNSVIMSVAGWTSERQMLDYVKLTHIEQAKELKIYWDKKHTQSA